MNLESKIEIASQDIQALNDRRPYSSKTELASIDEQVDEIQQTIIGFQTQKENLLDQVLTIKSLIDDTEIQLEQWQ